MVIEIIILWHKLTMHPKHLRKPKVTIMRDFFPVKNATKHYDTFLFLGYIARKGRNAMFGHVLIEKRSHMIVTYLVF